MNVLSRKSQTTISQDALQQVPGLASTRPIVMKPEIAGLMSLMLRLIDQHGSLVVYFTASTHGEGTTTIARELAAVAARSDWCKVALVDAGYSASATNAHHTRRALLDSAHYDEGLPFQRIRLDGVELAEAKMTGANASLPSVDTVRSLFDRLRKEFVLVIVDSPPVRSSQQVAAFSAAADFVVIVVEAERTRSTELERTRMTLEQLGARILGVVLNKRRYWTPEFLDRLI